MKTSSALTSSLLRDDTDLVRVRAFLKRLPHEPKVGDFEEQMSVTSGKATAHMWQNHDTLIVFAYVDNANNLWFEMDPEHPSNQCHRFLFTKLRAVY